MAGAISTVDLSGIVTDIAAVKAVADPNAIDIAAVKVVVDALVVSLAAAQVDITAIKLIIDALAVLTESGGTVTTDGTEQNVYVNDTPEGVFRPVCVKIDCSNQTAGETIVIREYYRMKSGGDYILHDESPPYVGVIDPPEITVDLGPNRFGIKVTIEKTGGTNRDYDWEVFYEV